jgi:lipopolysaccharide/colanic/teichoic acid biosynthesis glycosyltransferase
MVIGVEARPDARFPAWKRALDIVIAVPALILALPVIGVAAIGIRRSGGGGPIFYRAVRVGEGGVPYTTLKLRTMRAGRGAEGAAITAADDARVTRLGRTLRATKVDELPQLWNVIKGQMSLVGPRPEDPRFVDWTQPLHATVFTARPGITGPAQIAYRHEESLLAGDDVERTYVERILPKKLELDAAYLQDRSITGDLVILAQTIRAVLR